MRTLLGATMMPHSLLEAMYLGEFTEMEMKILLFICRKTIGWNKETEWISTRYIEKNKIMYHSHAARVINSLVKKGAIIKEHINGGTHLSLNLERWGIEKRGGAEYAPPSGAESVPEAGQNQPQLKETNKKKATIKIPTAEKSAEEKEKNKLIADLVDQFQYVNPNHERLFMMKGQRAAIERLLDKFGERKVREILKVLPISNRHKYAPRITTPAQLEAKLADLVAFTQQQRSEQKKSEIGIAI